jgi:hypothetical protein
MSHWRLHAEPMPGSQVIQHVPIPRCFYSFRRRKTAIEYECNAVRAINSNLKVIPFVAKYGAIKAHMSIEPLQPLGALPPLMLAAGVFHIRLHDAMLGPENSETSGAGGMAANPHHLKTRWISTTTSVIRLNLC